MTEFVAKGRVIFNNATFVIDAADLKEAMQKARVRDYSDFDISGEVPEVTISIATVEYNETP